ncbi:MAG: hypothetical protein AAF849_14210 [Bacteroidota bacterium]
MKTIILCCLCSFSLSVFAQLPFPSYLTLYDSEGQPTTSRFYKEYLFNAFVFYPETGGRPADDRSGWYHDYFIDIEDFPAPFQLKGTAHLLLIDFGNGETIMLQSVEVFKQHPSEGVPAVRFWLCDAVHETFEQGAKQDSYLLVNIE